jgi:hypothetical protein
MVRLSRAGMADGRSALLRRRYPPRRYRDYEARAAMRVQRVRGREDRRRARRSAQVRLNGYPQLERDMEKIITETSDAGATEMAARLIAGRVPNAVFTTAGRIGRFATLNSCLFYLEQESASIVSLRSDGWDITGEPRFVVAV